MRIEARVWGMGAVGDCVMRKQRKETMHWTDLEIKGT
jgi:hypothetical protein